MPVVTEVFTPVLGPAAGAGHAGHAGHAGSSSQPPAATLRQLHGELGAIGLPVAGPEVGTTPAFGPATAARLTRFQQRYGLPAHGNLDPITGALLTVASLVSTETDRAKLRTALAGARNAVTGSATYDQWLARFAVMAGAYQLAGAVAPNLRDLWGNNLGSGLLSGG